MKRPYQRIVTIILSCVMIAVSVIGTAAAHTERTNYVDTLHNTRFGAGNINCAPSNSNRETGLHQILRQLGCPEELCQKVLNQLGSYRWYSIADCNRSQNCSPQPEPTAPTEKVIPTEAPTQLPKPTPTTAPSEQSTEAPTDAPTVPATELPPKPTEAPISPSTEAPAPTQIPTEKSTEPPQTETLSAYELEVVRLINEIRAQYGLGQLTVNTELSRVARIKSQDMHDKGYFSHTHPPPTDHHST